MRNARARQLGDRAAADGVVQSAGRAYESRDRARALANIPRAHSRSYIFRGAREGGRAHRARAPSRAHQIHVSLPSALRWRYRTRHAAARTAAPRRVVVATARGRASMTAREKQLRGTLRSAARPARAVVDDEQVAAAPADGSCARRGACSRATSAAPSVRRPPRRRAVGARIAADAAMNRGDATERRGRRRWRAHRRVGVRLRGRRASSSPTLGDAAPVACSLPLSVGRVRTSGPAPRTERCAPSTPGLARALPERRRQALDRTCARARFQRDDLRAEEGVRGVRVVVLRGAARVSTVAVELACACATDRKGGRPRRAGGGPRGAGRPRARGRARATLSRARGPAGRVVDAALVREQVVVERPARARAARWRSSAPRPNLLQLRAPSSSSGASSSPAAAASSSPPGSASAADDALADAAVALGSIRRGRHPRERRAM